MRHFKLPDGQFGYVITDIETGCAIFKGINGRDKVNVLIHGKRKLMHKGEASYKKALRRYKEGV